MMNALSTKQLQFEVAVNRNEAAYKQLFVSFYEMLYRYARSILQSSELAEEVVSDVMLKVWTMENRLPEIENLKVFLYTATRNASLNCLAKNAKHSRCQPIDEDCENVGCYATPEAHLLKAEWKTYLQKAIDALPEKCRSVYKMVREEGCSYKETAAILNISENTVDRHLSNAVQKIVAALKPVFNEKRSMQKKSGLSVGSWFKTSVLGISTTANSLSWKGSYT